MAIHARTADYNPDAPLTDSLPGRSGDASRPRPARTPPRAPDFARVDECLQLLARAVQQFHTYPATSPLCHTAVEACQRAFASLEHRDQVDFRVMPRELIVDESGTGRGTLVELELARRLHGASIAQVTIESAASIRELARFCLDLIQCVGRRERRGDLIELLAEHGVSRIALRPAYRPEVLEVGVASAAVTSLIDQQRERREELFATGGVVNHLYPPDRGWVRLDPSSRLPFVSLVDLALLAEDPEALATMLLRLTDEGTQEVQAAGDALSRKFSDVATLFAALDPHVARVMFSRLARAVLDLDPNRRQALLRRTILPGLLDGKIDGAVLKDFPDLALADSLCLLLDLETAAPEVVTTALARLELPPERQNAMMPLLRERLARRSGEPERETSLDVHARKLIRIDHGSAKSFAEFAAFDLALDSHAAVMLDQIRANVAATDIVGEQLGCLWRLSRLEANPDVAQRFAERAMSYLARMEQEQYWPVLAFWLARYGELAATLREPRPDVADAITASLARFCTGARVSRLVDFAARDEDGRRTVDAIVQAAGPTIAPALIAAAQLKSGEGKEARSRAAVQLLTDHAKMLAPAMVETLEAADVATRRIITRVLGLAGAGFEAPVAAQLASRDEQTVREALRSLARIGTLRAADFVRAAIEQGGWLASAGAETLWHFPGSEAHRQVRQLLAHREFVTRQPEVAARLLERAMQAGATGLQPILATLAPLRYRVWSPALARVGRRARTLLNQ